MRGKWKPEYGVMIPPPLARLKGIEKKIIWEVYCPSCYNIQSPEDLYKMCENCGSKLRRRPKNS